jgi:hypothetical protein
MDLEHTVDTIVVTKLPHLLNSAENPTKNSAMVRKKARMKLAYIHRDTLRYASRPFCISSGKIFCAEVSLSCHTSTGLNQ